MTAAIPSIQGLPITAGPITPHRADRLPDWKSTMLTDAIAQAGSAGAERRSSDGPNGRGTD